MLSQRTFPQGEDGTDDFLFTEKKVLPVMVIIFKIHSKFAEECDAVA